jgi:hypothetical protein
MGAASGRHPDELDGFCVAIARGKPCGAVGIPDVF